MGQHRTESRLPAGLPKAQGLYDPRQEHDSCGIGFVVNIKGRKSHEIVSQSLTILNNMSHRGGAGYERNSGDGAGILAQIPHRFFAEVCARVRHRAQGRRRIRRRHGLHAAQPLDEGGREGPHRASHQRGGSLLPRLARPARRRLLARHHLALGHAPYLPGLHRQGPERAGDRPRRHGLRAQALRPPQEGREVYRGQGRGLGRLLLFRQPVLPAPSSTRACSPRSRSSPSISTSRTPPSSRP